MYRVFKKAEILVETGEKIQVMFNPQEYNLDTGANYSQVDVPGLDGPITQFISGKSDILNIKLMFNTYKPPKYDASTGQVVEVSDNEMEAVTQYTSKIYNLTKIKGILHRPPKCVFKWGSLQFTGVVTEVKQKFTMFLESGKPVRAVVSVTFQSVLDPILSKKMSPWESPDRTKYRLLDESSSLWQLAYEEYGDADYWKVIAKANGIRNPLEITAGMEVVLPPIHP
jgi:hypothetical protein